MTVGAGVPVGRWLPPLRGATRRTVVLAVACYLGLLWLRLALPDWHAMVQMMIDNLAFNPSLIARKEFWQLFTYPFIEVDWVQLAAALLSIWMFGSMLEQQRGWRWMGEFYLAATVGGAALADLVGPLLGRWIPYVSGNVGTGGMWPFALSLVVAYAACHPEQPLRWRRLSPGKARLVTLAYVLVYAAVAFGRADRIGTLTRVCAALAGYAFLSLAPYRGVRAGLRARSNKVPKPAPGIMDKGRI